MAGNYTQLTDKLSLVFWPYLRLALLFLTSYGLLDGALLHWRPSFDPPALFWKFLGPSVVAAGLVLWLLWRRLRLLAESKRRGNIALSLSIIAVVTLACGTMHLHEYLRATLGHLEALESPAALADSRSPSTYYRFRYKHQTPRYAGIEAQTNTSDKGRTLVFHLYVATPLFASPADAGRPAAVWQGLHYSTQLSARATEAEKKTAYQAFLRRTACQFEQEEFAAPAGYYERIPNTDERAAYLRAARRTGLCPPSPTAPLLLLQPGQVALATLRQSAAQHLLACLGGGTALFFIMLLFPYLSATSAQAFWARHL